MKRKVPDLDETLQYSAFISSATFKALISICEKLVSFCGKKHTVKMQVHFLKKRCLTKLDVPKEDLLSYIKYNNNKFFKKFFLMFLITIALQLNPSI